MKTKTKAQGVLRMNRIKAPPERVIGFVNGKRVKTSAKKWLSIMDNPKNSVVFKEDKGVEPEVETRGYTEEEIKQSTEDDKGGENREGNITNNKTGEET